MQSFIWVALKMDRLFLYYVYLVVNDVLLTRQLARVWLTAFSEWNGNRPLSLELEL